MWEAELPDCSAWISQTDPGYSILTWLWWICFFFSLFLPMMLMFPLEMETTEVAKSRWGWGRGGFGKGCVWKSSRKPAPVSSPVLILRSLGAGIVPQKTWCAGTLWWWILGSHTGGTAQRLGWEVHCVLMDIFHIRIGILGEAWGKRMTIGSCEILF